MIYDFDGRTGGTIRLGVIGVGGIARWSHLPSLAKMRTWGWPITIAAIADPVPDSVSSAVRFLESNGLTDSSVRRYDDGAKLLAAGGLDAILILTPPSATPALIRLAIQTGVPVLAEKPVAPHAKALKELVEIESLHPASIVRIAYNRRSQPLAGPFRERLNELRNEAAPGAVHLEARLWRAARTESVFYEDTMVHALDFVLWSLGEMTVERIDWRPGMSPGGLASALRVELRSTRDRGPAATATLDVRPGVGRELESYEALGAAVELDLRYPASGRDAARLNDYQPGKMTPLIADATEDPVEDEDLLIARGFVPQLVNFLRLVGTTGVDNLDSGPCSLADAYRTLKLRDDILSGLVGA